MPRARIPLLPLFLSAMVIAFIAAVALRARSYAAVGSHSDITRTASAAVALDPNARELNAPATGTIQELPADGSQAANAPAAGMTQTSARMTRAQRFRELLSQPFSAAPQPPRVAVGAPVNPPAVAPQARPIPKPMPPAPQRAPQPPQISNNSQRPNPTQPGNGRGEGDPKNRPDPNDPTSDTHPPQLISAQFIPPQVRDGEDGVLYVTASDDLSGIRGISGTLTSPSGKALQGFSCQKDETIPNRYIGRVNIPKDAEEGQWRVNFISMSDNASNTANLHYSQGGIPSNAVLQVVSTRPDKTPPALRRVWIDRRAMKANERNTVFIDADDDTSGVKFASGVFQSPSKFARISFGCQKGGDNDPQWSCALNTPATLDCGDWQLEQVQLQDGANNMATIRQDNPIVGQVKVSIIGDSCDSTPPTLQGLTVEPRVVSNQGGAVVILTATVTDDSSGIYGVMAQAVGPGQGSGRWFPFGATAENPTIWTGKFEVPVSAGKGVWRVAFVQVIDKANNIKLYTQNDPLLVNATFQVK